MHELLVSNSLNLHMSAKTDHGLSIAASSVTIHWGVRKWCGGEGGGWLWLVIFCGQLIMLHTHPLLPCAWDARCVIWLCILSARACCQKCVCWSDGRGARDGCEKQAATSKFGFQGIYMIWFKLVGRRRPDVRSWCWSLAEVHNVVQLQDRARATKSVVAG